MTEPDSRHDPDDAPALWQAYLESTPAGLTPFAGASALRIDIAVAQCTAQNPQALPAAAFDAYVNQVKTAHQLWR